MDIWCSNELYSSAHKLILNRVRKYKGFHSLGDVTLVDGVTIDPFALTDEPSDSSRVFSVERPTRADFRLFRTAIRNLSSAALKLPHKLGKYISNPHRPDKWFVSDDGDILYQHIDNSQYVRYVRDVTRRRTRGGTRYIFPTTCRGQCPKHTRASVNILSVGDTVELHSTASVYTPSKSRQSFLQRLASLPNLSAMVMANGYMKACSEARWSWLVMALITRPLATMCAAVLRLSSVQPPTIARV
jgi:hypothetical protein